MIFLETSFLIAFYLKKDVHNKKAVEIEKSLGNRKKIINKMTLCEFLTVLRKKNLKTNHVKKYYNEILGNVIILDDSQYHNQAIENCLNNETGFFDNLHHITMAENGIKEIASFDNHFDTFKDIKRIY